MRNVFGESLAFSPIRNMDTSCPRFVKLLKLGNEYMIEPEVLKELGIGWELLYTNWGVTMTEEIRKNARCVNRYAGVDRYVVDDKVFESNAEDALLPVCQFYSRSQVSVSQNSFVSSKVHRLIKAPQGQCKTIVPICFK